MANRNRKTEGLEEIGPAVDAAHAELDDEARQAEVAEPPANPTVDALRTWRKVQQIRIATEKDKERTTAAAERLKEERSALVAEARDIKIKREEAEELLAASAQKQRDLAERELNAEHGFRMQNEQALSVLQARATELWEQIAEIDHEAPARRAELEHELLNARRDRLAALDREIDDLRAERAQELQHARDCVETMKLDLAKQLEQAVRERRTLKAERAVLADDRAVALEEAQLRYAAKLEELEAAKKALTDRLSQARQDRDGADKKLAEAQEELRRDTDGRPLAVIRDELETLRARNTKLEADAAAMPSADSVARLEGLLRTNEALEDELIVVQRERNELEIAKQRERGHLAEVEVLNDKARGLESAIAAYQSALDDQKQRFDELVETQATRSPFERLSAMDTTKELNESPSGMSRPAQLTELVEDLQMRMATDPVRPGRPLFFRRQDIRVFLAGLSMSHLHLLQGISGTGKTSLPLAFARALGGGSAVIEVQAGWRDRQDLLGHYNTFERRYDETPFVQALYQAQCPAYDDRPYIVVLDEMNLSYPEQYFADLLSALESGELALTLTNTTLAPAPARLEKGRILRIPKNVWFVGTANHDETTKPFADKTYDRSHVQELPSRRPSFDVESVSPHGPVSLDALLSLFDGACMKRAADATKASAYLQAELGEVLADRFAVGWGNRLDGHIERFVPIVLEAGGTLGEAVDHLLSTKILRKVRGRHDVTKDDIDALDRRLNDSWAKLGVDELDDGQPRPCVWREILAAEMRRLGGGLT